MRLVIASSALAVLGLALGASTASGQNSIAAATSPPWTTALADIDASGTRAAHGAPIRFSNSASQRQAYRLLAKATGLGRSVLWRYPLKTLGTEEVARILAARDWTRLYPAAAPEIMAYGFCPAASETCKSEVRRAMLEARGLAVAEATLTR